MKITDKEIKILEEDFNIYEDNENYELENWTNGGVDMLIYINKNEEKDLITQMQEYIDNFEENMDEEIDMYRQDKDYRSSFTIRESIKDFEDYVLFINNIIIKLEEIDKERD